MVASFPTDSHVMPRGSRDETKPSTLEASSSKTMTNGMTLATHARTALPIRPSRGPQATKDQTRCVPGRNARLLLLVVSNTRFCARDLMPSTNNSCQQRLVLLLMPERDDHTHTHTQGYVHVHDKNVRGRQPALQSFAASVAWSCAHITAINNQYYYPWRPWLLAFNNQSPQHK